MDNLKTLLLSLKELGCSGIKVSFEDEGALLNEIITMRYLTACLNLELSIKIGGCEAKRDIVDSIDVCCDAIVAPMVESRFSLSKFTDSLDKYGYKNKKGFNLETITAYENMDSIVPEIKKCDFVTVGRVDFANSMNKDRSYVDSTELFNKVKNVFTSVKQNNIECYLGGAITTASFDFIRTLANDNLIDKFETRYVIFDIKNIDFQNFNKLISSANLFEIEWMKFIKNKYDSFANKDYSRIKMMEARRSSAE